MGHPGSLAWELSLRSAWESSAYWCCSGSWAASSVGEPGTHLQQATAERVRVWGQALVTAAPDMATAHPVAEASSPGCSGGSAVLSPAIGFMTSSPDVTAE